VYLKNWLQVWQRAAISPWVLPPDLALNDNAVQAQPSEDLEQPAWQRSIKKLSQVLEIWKGESFDWKGAPPKREQEDCALHDDWQLILRGQDVAACLLERMSEDAVRLYQPLKQYVQVLKQ
jgi:exodeoxyribonuclease V gamma subunit